MGSMVSERRGAWHGSTSTIVVALLLQLALSGCMFVWYSRQMSCMNIVQPQQKYNMKIRKLQHNFSKLDKVLAEQQQHPASPAEDKRVDIVYLWVNGTDPQLQAALALHSGLQQKQPQVPTASNGTQLASRQSMQLAGSRPKITLLEPLNNRARFDSSRDELRYSLRSLERYLPWYHRLFLVTNGQVPAWLNVSNPRITIVPHSTIFDDPADLPTFNSHAIQTKLLNVPGLSASFIVMDDDFFLTVPWYLSDFISADGAEVITGTGLVSQIKGRLNNYLAAVKHVDQLFTQNFGPWPHKIPSHAPYFLQQQWMRRVQQEFPNEYLKTASNRFRSGDDMQMAAAYKWYVDQHQPGEHFHVGDTTAGFISLTTVITREAVRAQLKDANATQPFNAVANFRKKLHATLQVAWAQPGIKLICMNDDVDQPAALAAINPVVSDFLSARYPRASEYELPDGMVNKCKYIASPGFGVLPTQQTVAAACAMQTQTLADV